MKITLALYLFTLISLLSCQRQPYQLHEKQVFVFGTIAQLSVWHDNADQANQALLTIEQHFQQMHTLWHAWKPGRLSEINCALRNSESISVTTQESEIFRQLTQLSNESEGLFNPAIGALINLWGFHTDEYPITTAPPTVQQIQQLAQHQPSMQDLKIENNQLSTNNPHIWIDLGGVAKGMAVDQAIEILKQHDIDHAIINTGGDLRSMGKKNNKPWRVAIQSPAVNDQTNLTTNNQQQSQQNILAIVDSKADEAIFTSGNYYRYKAFDGQRYSHIIDGRTGMPVNQIISATVIAPTGMRADAAATALLVAGMDQWLTVLNNMHIDQALIIDQHNTCFSTEKMYARLQQLNINCHIAPL